MKPIRATAANPLMLTWARVQAGLTVEDVSARLSVDPVRIKAWEDAVDAPTFRQLRDLASFLKRPVAIFFFDDPPEEPDDAHEFRISPLETGADGVSDTRYAIREARARQSSILEITGGSNAAGEQYLFASGGVSAETLRDRLDVSLEQQIAWRDSEVAFKAWRAAVEAHGVVVFKRAFKQKSVSGFCLFHAVAPIVVLNNSTTWNRQIFTLFHELAHIEHRVNGVTRASFNDSSPHEIENACNRFSADFLLPPTRVSVPVYSGLRSLDSTARRYHVSREVVLRRMLDEGKVSPSVYDKAMTRMAAGYHLRSSPEESGGSFYSTTASYLGPTYLNLVFDAHYARRLDLYEVADALGVRPVQVSRLEAFAARGVS